MDYNDQRSTRPTLPPFSSRTLHHPSFMPLYMAAGSSRPHTDYNNQPVHPITPAEIFYSDPTISCERRIPNIVTDLPVFDCFQLNTPPPVMSACLAPPARPDPFRSAPCPTRDLGGLTLDINNLDPPVQTSRVVLQLTQEEDQVITNLLTLHHQEPLRSEEETLPQTDPVLFLSPPEPMDSSSPPGQLQQGRCWSGMELDAADTLLSHFSLMEEDQIWIQNRSAGTPTLSPNASGPSSDSEGFSEEEEQTISDSERDAVVGLGDIGL